MQFVVNQLNRPWGLNLQIGLLGGWISGRDGTVSIHTTSLNKDYFPTVASSVVVSSNPSTTIDADQPTLTGPYPAVRWTHRAGVDNYSILMSHIPWNLYPKKKNQWLGRLPVYVSNNSQLLWRSIMELLLLPWHKTRLAYRRFQDQRSVQAAREIYIYDDRLRKPVRDVYDRDPTLISPVAAIGGAKTSDPDKKIVAMGPHDPIQNTKRIIDAFYLFVNRLGTQRREDWDGRNPMQMWQAGDFVLELHGTGDGEDYLREYADSQQLEDQVTFEEWVPSEDYESVIGDAMAVVDVPLAGDASTLVYHALAMGVPAVHTRYHRGLDTFIEDSSLSFKTSSTDTTAIGKSLLDAVKVPSSERMPNKSLKKALEVESGAEHLTEELRTSS